VLTNVCRIELFRLAARELAQLFPVSTEVVEQTTNCRLEVLRVAGGKHTAAPRIEDLGRPHGVADDEGQSTRQCFAYDE
jgi:hypothetical protein